MFILAKTAAEAADVVCGGGKITMDSILPTTTSLLVTLIKIGVPVLLIVFGMLDLGKAVMAQKEDEIKKSQQLFVKRIISAALVFFVVVIVQVIFNLVSDNSDVWDCVSCFVNGPADSHSTDYCVTTKKKK